MLLHSLADRNKMASIPNESSIDELQRDESQITSQIWWAFGCWPYQSAGPAVRGGKERPQDHWRAAGENTAETSGPRIQAGCRIMVDAGRGSGEPDVDLSALQADPVLVVS